MTVRAPVRIRPGLTAALAALVTVLACQRGADDGDGAAAGAAPAASEPAAAPRLAHADTGPVLTLPPVMSRALAAYAPEFSPWRRDAYDADVLAHFTADPTEPLFGAVGDFNGDGRADVALQGFTPREELFFVLLSDGDTARVVELRRRDLYYAPRGLQRDIYLRAVPAGTRLDLPSELGGQPPELRHDAFEEVVEGRAGVLHYWTGERFATYMIGD